jgi:hypothetical protein
MAPLGFSAGQVIALLRETQAIEGTPRHVAVAGPGARELAAALAEGGDASAVVVGGDPAGAAVTIHMVSGAVSQAEAATLRRSVRAGRPVVVVRFGTVPVPYALPDDIVDAGEEVPLAAVASAIARAAPDAAPVLAARLPVLRPAVERHLISVTSWGNALIAASSGRQAPQLPLLSIAQSRMLLLLGAGRGERLPQDPKGIAAAVGPSLAASIGLGLAARTLVRRLPARGPLARGAVAYAGTRALGVARLRLP